MRLSQIDASGFSVGQQKKTPTNVLMAPILLHGERNPEFQLDDEVPMPL